ncbi:MAG: four-carbon acid sugar kinase family protein [Bacteroidota bacterium]|nr:four-carbon acid sugar kinase family protein [Bacteroidota bacterium]
MIAVIADDFTGAAEIGGIGLRYGLNVVIETEDIQGEDADLLIIATDTRSLSAKEASDLITRITKKLIKLNPQFIFKKVDSVLRGNITDELNAQMKAMDKKRALIVAANPIFNRVIRNGMYYIGETPLNETGFSTDPEFPISSSNVLEIISNEKNVNVFSAKPGETLPEEGIIIGDVTGLKDLGRWVSSIDNDTVIAGASGFFDALLSHQFSLNTNNVIPMIPFGEKALYVFGSTFPKEADFIQRLEDNGYYFSNMPKEIYYNKNFDPCYLEYWANDIVDGIKKHHKVVASIDYTPSDEPDIAFRIKENMGQLIKKITDRVALNELLIEGGGTTSVALKYLHIKKLLPVQELETGVIRMKIDNSTDFCLTTKPGSYFWPECVWFPEVV